MIRNVVLHPFHWFLGCHLFKITLELKYTVMSHFANSDL